MIAVKGVYVKHRSSVKRGRRPSLQWWKLVVSETVWLS